MATTINPITITETHSDAANAAIGRALTQSICGAKISRSLILLRFFDSWRRVLSAAIRIAYVAAHRLA